MMKNTHWSDAEGEALRQQVGIRSRWLSAASVYLFIAVVVSIFFSELLKPLLAQLPAWRGAAQDTSVPMWEVLKWLSLRALAAAPTIVLAGAIWEAHTFLQRLVAGDWQSRAVAPLLRKVGASLLLSAALSAVVVPTLLQGGSELNLSTPALTLGALGGLLIVVADVLGEALRRAELLRAENDSFI